MRRLIYMFRICGSAEALTRQVLRSSSPDAGRVTMLVVASQIGRSTLT